jgi:membrane associated rhomboid family serine protease
MLLPYASDRPPRNAPLTVVTLVLVHFAIFGVIALNIATRGPERAVIWYANLSLVPGSIKWWSPITYSFLHDSVFHLSSNMLFLWVFGGSLEDAIGRRRFISLYVGAAILTGLLQCTMAILAGGLARSTPIIGASGAIAALVGAFAVRFYRSRIRFIGLPVRIPALILVLIVLLGEMAVAIWQLTHPTPAVQGQAAAHWAHVGGFLIGMLWAQSTRLMRAGRHEYLAADAAVEMERGSPIKAVHRWEAVLHEQPDNLHAEAELARAWAMVGEKDQAAEHYQSAIAGMVRSGDRADAAARYLEARTESVEAHLPPAELLAVASSLEEAGEYETSRSALVTLIDSYPEASECETARLRLASLLLKRLNSPKESAAAVKAYLDDYPESTWRAYAEELLRSAENVGNEPESPV